MSRLDALVSGYPATMAYSDKPIDDARTTQPQAGMAFKDRRELPGLALAVVGVLALVGCLTAAAMRDGGWAIGLGVIALLTLAGGIGWIFAGRRRTARAGSPRSQR